MSADGDSGPGRREVAYRLFAAEFDDASLSYSESDEERAPNFVVTPTGLRVNRLFAVGVLTEVESINEDTLRGRIVDPTGAFVTYAGQYQPPAQAFLDQTTPPAFVAITGKARTFEPEDSDRVFTSVRPESLSEVDADTRDRWVVSAAKATLHRIAVCAAALDSSLRGEALQDALTEAGVEESLAVGIPRALDHYGTTTAYLDALRQVAIDALELVADERDEVRSLDIAPNEGGETALGAIPSVDIDLAGEPASEPASKSEPEPASEPASTEEPADEDEEPTAGSEPTEPDTETASSSPTEPEEPADTATPEASETVTNETAAGSAAAPDADPGADDASTESTETVVDDVAAAEPDTEAANGASDPDMDAETAATADDDATEADAEGAAEETGMYQLDEEEREELESEFDTGFSSGNDVDPAGEADIDVPDADELAEQAQAEEAATAETETVADEETLGEFDDGLDDFEDESSTAEPVADDEPPVEPDTEMGDESSAVDDTSDDSPAADDEADEPVVDTEADETAAAEIDLEETVVETMAELDDGDGVDRDELVSEIVDTYGVDETAVEGAIADALMGGRCYEPGDGVLKAI